MSNVIDINDRLARRQRDNDFKEVGQLVRRILETAMVDSDWPHLFAGVTQLPIMVDWPDREWATFRLDSHQLEKGPDNELFGAVYSFNTDYRRQYVPEFGNQTIVEILSMRLVMRDGIIKSPGVDDYTKQALMDKLLDYANSFSQFTNTKFAFQLGFLSNLFKNNTIIAPNVRDVDGKWELTVCVPANNPEAGAHMVVTLTFDFLPLVLDHMATQFVLQLPEDQV